MITAKAKKLLGDNDGHMLWGGLGIRYHEESLTHARLLEFIKEYPVLRVETDRNSYGEFMFITVACTEFTYDNKPYPQVITFWGLGYHEFRDVMIVNWQINVGNACLYQEYRAMPKKQVIHAINERMLQLGITQDTRQEKSGNAFEFLADLTDDDYAIINLE